VEQGHPVVAAIFNPATDELFSAARGRDVTLNGHPIHVTRPSSDRMTILVNPRAHDKGQFASYTPHAEIRPMGSIAYTLALVAAGRADATLNFEWMNEWDIVAGAFLVEEAGGFAVNGSWRPLRFNQADTTVLGTIAGSRAVRSALEAVMRRAS
ncbi:MAG: inositol monophosphatase family protein, partial [Nitrospirales bacterium]